MLLSHDPGRMRRRYISWSFLAAVVIVATGSTAWLAGRPPTAGCASAEPVASGQTLILGRAIVARPWYGPHHVYGLFQVPERFGRGHVAATLRVGSFQEPADLQRGRWSDSAIAPMPGHYLKRVYVPTRTALRFLVSGHFGDLRTACNWTLEVLDQGHDSGENDLSPR